MKTFSPTRFIVLATLLLVTSCQKEEATDSIHQPEAQSFSIKRIGKKDLDKNVLSKINTNIQKVKRSLFQSNGQAKFSYNESFGFLY